MKKVLITGGTGMVGKVLSIELVSQGYDVIILSRGDHQSSVKGITYAKWDIKKGMIDEIAIQQAEYIIHLAGANLASGRWTKKRKKIFTESRVKSGELLVSTLKNIPNLVKAVISASAIGYYGADEDGPGRPFVETDPPDHHFLGELVQKWESAIKPVTSFGKRLVILRFGMILSKEGGAYKEFKFPLKFGIATILGSGKQVVSWIHIEDAVKIYIACIQNENLSGVYNSVSPIPTTNKNMMSAIANASNALITFRVPAFILKLVFGEMSTEVLKSATVSSEKIQKEGFRFLFPDIDSAIQKLEAS